MAKNNIKRRHNKTLDLSSVKRYRPLNGRVFSGETDTGIQQSSEGLSSLADTASSVLGDMGLDKASGVLGKAGGVIGGVTQLADIAMKNAQIADTSGIESSIEDTKFTDFTDKNDSSSLLDSWNSLNWQNSDYEMKDVRGLSTGQMVGNTISSIATGAMAGAQVAPGPWGLVGGAIAGLGSSLAGIFVGNKKAREKAEELNRLAEEANKRQTNSFNTQVASVNQESFMNRLANVAANGGPLKTPYASSLGYDEIDFGEGEPFTIPSGYSYLTIPGTNKLKIRAALSTGESPYHDSWNEKRLSTGRFTDQLGNGNMEMQKVNRDSATFSFSPDKNYDYDPLTGEARVGYFNAARNSGWIGNEYYTRPTLDIHEKAHASKATPQMKVIQEILGDSYTDKYWDDPDEVYSRLMEIRKAYDLDPLKIYNKDDIKDLKKRGFQNNFLDRYDDNTLIRLFNDVADNNSTDYTNYAKDGGKIHIKPSKRGTFTAAAKKHGKSVQAFASQVLANKENYSPAMVKKANFARNFGGRKHDLGGYLFTHGADWSNGVTKVDAGGTHSENPYEGVPMGIAPDGVSNLVEQGEVIFNDYVFSNRLHPSEKELEKANLPKRYKGHTFALIAEDMGKESSERPNDPISKRGLEDSMMKLAMVQEAQRAKKGKKGTQQLMAYGGRKYAGNSDLDNPYNDPYIGSKEQALEEAELNYYASKSPEIQEGLRQIRANNQASDPLPTWMRYVPAAGSAIGAIQSIFQKPDYENADILMQEARNLSRPSVRYRALNNYLTYRPLDRNYYLNQLKGQAGATRRGIMNSGSNAGSIMAGLLAADYNAQNAVGSTLMKMEQYNDAQRQKVAEFNRGTDQYNSQAAMSADAQNAQIAQNRDRLKSTLMTQAAQMREAADTALEATRSGNLTNFFDNMGGIGQDNMAQNWRNRLIDVGYFGAGSDRVVRKNGGRMLTKKNRRRK